MGRSRRRWRSTISTPGASGYHDIPLADFDGYGHLDIAHSGFFGDLGIYRNRTFDLP